MTQKDKVLPAPRFRQLPNYITALRMVGSVCLIFIRPLSPLFFGVYTLAGITDALDGYIARKTHTASAFGAKLDSAADLLFYTIMLVKLLPVLIARLPAAIWYGVGAVLVIRLASYGVALVKYHRFAALHTYWNKFTGACVFAVPYILGLPVAGPLCIAITVVAGISSLEELVLHLRGSGEAPKDGAQA